MAYPRSLPRKARPDLISQPYHGSARARAHVSMSGDFDTVFGRTRTSRRVPPHLSLPGRDSGENKRFWLIAVVRTRNADVKSGLRRYPLSR